MSDYLCGAIVNRRDWVKDQCGRPADFFITDMAGAPFLAVCRRCSRMVGRLALAAIGGGVNQTARTRTRRERKSLDSGDGRLPFGDA